MEKIFAKGTITGNNMVVSTTTIRQFTPPDNSNAWWDITQLITGSVSRNSLIGRTITRSGATPYTFSIVPIILLTDSEQRAVFISEAKTMFDVNVLQYNPTYWENYDKADGIQRTENTYGWSFSWFFTTQKRLRDISIPIATLTQHMVWLRTEMVTLGIENWYFGHDPVNWALANGTYTRNQAYRTNVTNIGSNGAKFVVGGGVGEVLSTADKNSNLAHIYKSL